jgi:hypothetical protein
LEDELKILKGEFLSNRLGELPKSKTGETWDIVPTCQTSLPPLKLGTLISTFLQNVRS